MPLCAHSRIQAYIMYKVETTKSKKKHKGSKSISNTKDEKPF